MSQALAVLAGAAAGLALVLWSRRLGPGEPKFWSRALIVMQAIYLLFALAAREVGDSLVEALVLTLFTAVAVAGWRRAPWLLALGMLAHGGWDLRHLLAGEGWVLPFYPELCVGFDWLVFVYLAARAGSWRRERRRPTSGEATA